MSPSMPLTDAEILALKPMPKSYKVSIGKGAYILVRPDGAKYWRFKYYLNGKEGIYALGVFPEVSIEAAWTARDSARGLVQQGINPSIARRQAKASTAAAQATSHTVFRLSLSKSGALTIETATNALTLTLPQRQALSSFLLNADKPHEKESQ
jgi:Arm DNA-binding domain